jgi:hypothetical protein
MEKESVISWKYVAYFIMCVQTDRQDRKIYFMLPLG